MRSKVPIRVGDKVRVVPRLKKYVAEHLRTMKPFKVTEITHCDSSGNSEGSCDICPGHISGMMRNSCYGFTINNKEEFILEPYNTNVWKGKNK